MRTDLGACAPAACAKKETVSRHTQTAASTNRTRSMTCLLGWSHRSTKAGSRSSLWLKTPSRLVYSALRMFPAVIFPMLILLLATEPTPRAYTCLRASGPIVIDGQINEPAWRRAPWTKPFADIEGGTKPRPRFRTRMKMLWDDEYLYIAAELQEPHVWATLTEHDAVIFRDNDFEVFLNPTGDGRNYFEFEMNALNTGWDLFLPKPYKDGGSADNSWEIPGLRTAVHVDGTLNDPRNRDRGWTLEIAIPWTAYA